MTIARKFMSASVGLATLLPVALAQPSAASSLIDFTDSSAFGPGSAGSSITGSVKGVGYTVVSTGGNLVFPEQGSVGGTCPADVLACGQDGAGVGDGDDEVTAIDVGGGETVTITFERSVELLGLHFLDLFSADDGDTSEEAQVSADGGAFATITASLDEQPGDGDSGYLLSEALNGPVRSLLFQAPSVAGLDGNDNLGTNDFAIGAVEIGAVPLPAGALLFGSALGGLGLVGRRRRRAA